MNEISNFIFTVCCVILILSVGAVVYVAINSPIITDKQEQISQPLNYSDYESFVEKDDEACQK